MVALKLKFGPEIKYFSLIKELKIHNNSQILLKSYLTANIYLLTKIMLLLLLVCLLFKRLTSNTSLLSLLFYGWQTNKSPQAYSKKKNARNHHSFHVLM